jgi:hypothetical protein
MITAIQIAAARPKQSDDIILTQKLIAYFSRLRNERAPLFLTAADLEKVLIWKLRNQLGRQRELRRENTDELIRTITGVALSVCHRDRDYELQLRVSLLCALRGIAVPVASAILSLTNPEQYGVIDFRGWRQIFDEEHRGFLISDYIRYMAELHRLAGELFLMQGRRWTPQEVDFAIWIYDDQQHRPQSAG